AVELINKGLAYVCFLTADQAREYRGTLKEPGKNSPYRDTASDENLALFEKMRNGEFKEGECVLRAKIDMASSFMVLRDPIIYR
ncbi:glutamate--tRNA ligase family protein, partial [Psychrobacter sp. CAL346-MNA-CIBAN-0220]